MRQGTQYGNTTRHLENGQNLPTAPLDNENQLEEQVFQDISILNPDCLLIVLQGSNGFGM
ncbi:hypothetical protein [Endozoicomonas sp. 2B-B]